ncbi:MAG: TetR/AcrR family transcriptional regulator [Candidatus Gracilibacteria bacterium]|nr:TetR/AcrR family transcriptional regulator [Candidatus Gracilibacteria bacterium]
MSKIKIEPVEILDTIESLFFGKTFGDLSMDEIARELGMKKASLYYHFPSKESMFLAVMERSYTKYISRMREAIQGDLRKAIPDMIVFASETKNLFSVVSQKGYCSNPNLRDAIQSRVKQLRIELADILAERFGWSIVKASLFLTLLDTYSKEYCLAKCIDPFDARIIDEIQNLFSF